MARFKVGEESFISKVDESAGYDTPLSNFGVEKGDKVIIKNILRERNDYGVAEYGVDVIRDGEVIESDISASEMEILGRCDSNENHELVYHDKREDWICPFCNGSQ